MIIIITLLIISNLEVTTCDVTVACNKFNESNILLPKSPKVSVNGPGNLWKILLASKNEVNKH